jgi:signal transduction histidine kinase
MLTINNVRGLPRQLLLLMLLGAMCSIVRAQAAPLDVGYQGQEQADFVSLASHFAVLEDSSQRLSLNDVLRPEVAARFQQDPHRKTDLNFGQTQSAIWLRLQLKNSSDQPTERLLQLAYVSYLDLQFFTLTGAQGYTAVKTGRTSPFAERPYPNRFFVFPVSVAAHSEQTVYLRIKSVAVTLPAKLWQAGAFHRHERTDYTIQAAYFGSALAMFLFNLFLFAMLRERMYLWYLTAQCCVVLTIAEQSGLAKEYLWPNAPGWSLVAINMGYVFSVAALMAFMRRMLDTSRTMLRLDYGLRLLSVILLCSVLGLAVDTEHFAPMVTWLALMGLCAMLVTGVYGVWLRLRSAYFFVAAFSVLLVGGAAYAMRNLSLLAGNPFIAQALQIGSALEMIILALALADRFLQIRLENIRVHKDALAAQNQLVEVLKSSERQLEQRVTERTGELSSALQKLQTAQAHLLDSERRATEGEHKALDALAAQQQFIAMVSHEIRSPLAVIDNSAQMLAKKAEVHGDSKLATLVERILRGTVRLTQFLDTCMTQDRLRDVGLLLKPTALDAAALAHSVRENAQQLTEHHRIFADVQPELPPLQADEALLRILLANLLGNAIKYSPHGSQISLRVTHSCDRHIFEVIDQGCGIPADEMPHIFKKYRRGRLAAGKPGAGLGLALGLQIVELHGGSIRVNSTQDRGTQVVVEFPAESSADANTSQLNDLKPA